MQPTKAQLIDTNSVKADLAAAEREAQFVNQEQIMSAALFAKQLRADLNGIRSAAVGEGLKVGDIDIAKVMPSEILRAYRPTNMPVQSPATTFMPPVTPVTVPNPSQVTTPGSAPVYPAPLNLPSVLAATVSQQNNVDTNQLEFNFDKVARYEEVVEAIERLEIKINNLTSKVEQIIDFNDKKKLKTNLDNGTQAG